MIKNSLILMFAIATIISSGCKKNEDDNLPRVKTMAISNIRSTMATFYGFIDLKNGESVNSGGVCWSTSKNPTVKDSKLIEFNSYGDYYATIAGLEYNTKYYARAYASNSSGTSYGDTISFTTLNDYDGKISDIDSNLYQTVKIGNQIWMAENLKTSKFRNGDIIGTTTPLTLDISNDYHPIYEWPSGGDESFVKDYGRLYTFWATMNYRKACPSGWHVPSLDDWLTLENFLVNNGYGYNGSGKDIGKALASKTVWKYSEIVGNIGNDINNNNSSGFSALPAGNHSMIYNGSYINFEFKFFTENAEFWTTTLLNSNPFIVSLSYSDNELNYYSYSNEYEGHSIRCIKD